MLGTWRTCEVSARWSRFSRSYHASKDKKANENLSNCAIWQEFRSNHRPTWAEINLDHVAHNVQSLRSKLPKSATLIAVVKADGYGHGAEWVGKAALEAGAQRLAVATVEEGIVLRRSGIIGSGVDIQILGLSAPGTEKSLLSHNLIPTIASEDSITRFIEAGRALHLKKPFRYHLKLDTGMGRVGLVRNDEDALFRVLGGLQEYAVMEGIFTHFSKADEVDKTHTKQQTAQFRESLEKLPRHKLRPALIHSTNSAGIIDSHLIYTDHDMAAGTNAYRMGISLYGFWPSQDVAKTSVPPLKPIMTWKTEIIQLKTLEPGHTISYGGEYITHHTPTSKIATLPIGYADGYRRLLGSNLPDSPPFHVLIRGKSAPIVGRVCMDMCHVDVTNIPDAAAGDEVVLVGHQGAQLITADDMATKLRTINYEISCLLGKRVPRLYTKGGRFIAIKSLISDTQTSL